MGSLGQINIYVQGGEAVASSSTSNENDTKRQQEDSGGGIWGRGQSGPSACPKRARGLLGRAKDVTRYNRSGTGPADRGRRWGRSVTAAKGMECVVGKQEIDPLTWSPRS